MVELVTDWIGFCMGDLRNKELMDSETRVAEAELVSLFGNLGEELEQQITKYSDTESP